MVLGLALVTVYALHAAQLLSEANALPSRLPNPAVGTIVELRVLLPAAVLIVFAALAANRGHLALALAPTTSLLVASRGLGLGINGSPPCCDEVLSSVVVVISVVATVVVFRGRRDPLAVPWQIEAFGLVTPLLGSLAYGAILTHPQ
jgi:hypothetical protein